MSKKTAKSEKKSPGKGPGFILELTRKQLYLWLVIIFLGMAWMFTVGVLVGRGISPVRFDIQNIKQELMALKQEALKRDSARFKVERDDLSGGPELDFYKVLTDRKKEARLKFAKSHEPAEKTDAKSTGSIKTEKMKGPGLLTIQVASLKSAKAARKMVASLKSKGYDAYKVRASVPGKGTFHRIRVGHFADSNEAGRVAAKLRQDKVETMIVRE